MGEKQERAQITAERMNRYLVHLAKKGYTGSTMSKYSRDISAFGEFAGGEVTCEALEEWKAELSKTHSAASVNSMLAAVKSYAGHFGVETKVRRLKESYRSLLVPQASEMTQQEYAQLLRAAAEQGNERLALMMRTMCATGIQVSELREVTVEAAQSGQIMAAVRGKLGQRSRIAPVPGRLKADLLEYAARQGIASGSIFVTRSGSPVNRSNIWTQMKRLCESAGVDAAKAFPQNLRYLSMRTFYDDDRDLAIYR